MRSAVAKAGNRPDLRGIVLVVLGEEGQELREGGATVFFVPYQSDRRTVARYYRAADVYLHAAIADTYPGAVAEALACGTPVVATETGGIPELVHHGTSGFLVPPRDADALADRVEQLLTDDALREKMGAAAALVAQREYGLDRQVEAYLQWYAEVHDGWAPAG